MTQELQQIKQYANAQRAQTHEFSNSLYTILGLLQLGGEKKPSILLKEKKYSREAIANLNEACSQSGSSGTFTRENQSGE